MLCQLNARNKELYIILECSYKGKNSSTIKSFDQMIRENRKNAMVYLTVSIPYSEPYSVLLMDITRWNLYYLLAFFRSSDYKAE